MWEKLLSWVHLLWNAGVETEKNSSRIATLSESNRQLAEAFNLLVVQQQHDREMSQQRIESLEREVEVLRRSLEGQVRDSQEKTELRLRLEISERMRQLPAPKKSDKEKPA